MTGQAMTYSYRSRYQLQRDLLVAQHLNVGPPNIVTGSAEAITVLLDKEGVAIRSLQNCSTIPLKYAINMDCDASHFHGILAGCSATDDGLGSFVDLSRFKGSVSVYSAGAIRVCVFEAIAPEYGVA